MKTAVAGKFDPVHAGHIDHIVKASKLGDYLYIITHTDQVVAAHSSKGFCAVPLKARIATLEGIMNYHGIKGEVVMADSPDGTCADMLRKIKPDFFAKGGDRVEGNLPQNELDVCKEIGCRIVYGIGDLLNSSSKIMADAPKYMPTWVLRKSNEQYDIYDCRIACTVVSITYLKPHQSTSGHQHPHSEYYNVIEGKGVLQIGENQQIHLKIGFTLTIQPNTFHKVRNGGEKALIFLCVWRGEDKS